MLLIGTQIIVKNSSFTAKNSNNNYLAYTQGEEGEGEFE